MFEDTQVKGPYRKWIHQHIFEETERGTLMRDRVSYASPGWFLEPLVHHLFVKNSIRRIFDYRRKSFSVYFTIADAAKAR
jgi:ligand-binding SRPBCC domain-containing protein